MKNLLWSIVLVAAIAAVVLYFVFTASDIWDFFEPFFAPKPR